MTVQPTRDEKKTMNEELVILRVKGTKFRCHCGATVFRPVPPNRYECNACNELYEGE